MLAFGVPWIRLVGCRLRFPSGATASGRESAEPCSFRPTVALAPRMVPPALAEPWAASINDACMQPGNSLTTDVNLASRPSRVLGNVRDVNLASQKCRPTVRPGGYLGL